MGRHRRKNHSKFGLRGLVFREGSHLQHKLPKHVVTTVERTAGIIASATMNGGCPAHPTPTLCDSTSLLVRPGCFFFWYIDLNCEHRYGNAATAHQPIPSYTVFMSLGITSVALEDSARIFPKQLTFTRRHWPRVTSNMLNMQKLRLIASRQLPLWASSLVRVPR